MAKGKGSSYARLKPYAPKQGYPTKRRIYRGARFITGRWYEILDPGFAKELAKLKQDEDHPIDSRDLMDVCESKPAMKKLLENEKKAKAKAMATSDAPETIATVATQAKE